MSPCSTRAPRRRQEGERVVGVISDTHGLLRSEAALALEGSDLIVHAGDVGSPEVLSALERLAPLSVVRGNVDRAEWAQALPSSSVVEVAGQSLYVLHDLAQLDLDPTAAGFRVVVTGHSHQPCQFERDGVLYFNPGSAGPRRFRLPVSIGRLYVSDQGLRGELCNLEV